MFTLHILVLITIRYQVCIASPVLPQPGHEKWQPLSLAHPDGRGGVDGEVDRLAPVSRTRNAGVRSNQNATPESVERGESFGEVQELYTYASDDKQFCLISRFQVSSFNRVF